MIVVVNSLVSFSSFFFFFRFGFSYYTYSTPFIHLRDGRQAGKIMSVESLWCGF